MQHTMRMNLGGLISILAENLYADPDVFIREMIQNSHDAIAKRQLLSDDIWDFSQARIDVITDDHSGTITFSDNGAGLNEQEIHDYLSTIGSSDKRNLNQQLANGDHADARRLIGQFGIGLLSSFIVADKVQVATRAVGDPPLLWESHGDIHYSLTPGDHDSIGSSVTIYLQLSQRRYLDTAFLTRQICNYADLIGIPIYLNDSKMPINQISAPWHSPTLTQSRESHARFWQQRFDTPPALTILPLDDEFNYQDPLSGQTVTGRIQGVLAIPDQQLTLASAAEIDLFISRMFIASDLQHLLPSWAGFVSGVLETSDLSPNAARDNVMPGPPLEAFRDCLGQKIITWLTDLAKEQTEPFHSIVERHWQHLLQLYLQAGDQLDIEALIEQIPLPTNCGQITLAKYLATAETDSEGRKKISYLQTHTEKTQINALAAARGVSVINACHPQIKKLLNRYQQRRAHQVCLALLQEDEESLFRPVGETERQTFQPLLLRLADKLAEGVKVRLCHFQPADVPAVLSELHHQLARSHRELFPPEEDVPDYLAKALTQVGPSPTREIAFYLNVNNLLVLRLLYLCREQDDLADLLLQAMINNATMLHLDELSPQALRNIFAFNNQLLDQMLDRLQAETSVENDAEIQLQTKKEQSVH